ncbi:MAG: M48 family metalloprotease [Alphaproteobacteria bacterium]|nr:M48 family metalloprotease [Alphaproteobacteria bacterium]
MRKLIAVFLIIALFVAMPAAAQRQLSLIRDAEIESTIRAYAEPLFQVAGVSPRAVSIYLVNDPSVNAFVAGGQNLFIHTGLLLDARNAGEVIGVIAHETGHIAGGHIARGQDAIESAQRTALLTTLLGIAAAVASGDGRAGAAVVSGGLMAAERTFLSYTRSMENAADQAAATYLDRVGMSAGGLLSFFQRLEDQELLPASRQVEYVRTHPLTRDRIDFLRAHVARSRYTDAPVPDGLQEQFERMQAKLVGFLHPRIALRRYAADDPDTAVQYGRAIALYRQGEVEPALATMQQLLDREPDNPYFNEVVGQILLDNGRLAEARSYYQRATRLLPNEPLLLVALAQTKLAGDNPGDLESAIDDLTRATAQPGGGSPLAWRLLATAYGRAGELGMSAVALAEEALAQGDYEIAEQQAGRALQTVARGSSGWLRAQDIRRVAREERDD